MDRLSTGIAGLDQILNGGIAAGSSLIIAGPPGAGKTILAEQMMFSATGHRSVFFTILSEPHLKLIQYLAGFAWFEPARIGREIEYLSLYPTLRSEGTGPTLALIVQKVRETAATFVVLDAFRGLRDLVDDARETRRFLFDLGGQLGLLGATLVITGEYTRSDVTRSPECTLVDGIILLDAGLKDVQLIRSIEVLKFRGSDFLAGRHTVRIGPNGVVVYPRQEAIARMTSYRMGNGRVRTGVLDLDRMLGGGLIEHSCSVVIGTRGVGKTLLGLTFLGAGLRQGERGVMVSLDEAPAHLEQKTQQFGLGPPAQPFFDGERLRMIWEPAVELLPDVLATRLRNVVEGGGVRRVVLDAFTNLESALDPERLSDFIVSLTNYLRGHGVTTLLIKDVHAGDRFGGNLSGPTFATTADNLLVLWDVGGVERAERRVRVVKTRDSAFDPRAHAYVITAAGFQIGAPAPGEEWWAPDGDPDVPEPEEPAP